MKKNKKDNKKQNINKLIKIIGSAVGLTMGINVIVLFVFQKLSTNNAIIMLGIGLFCVSFPTIMKKN